MQRTCQVAWKQSISPSLPGSLSEFRNILFDFILTLERSFLLRNSLSDATLLEPAGANQSNLHARWEPLFCWARFSIVVFIPDSDVRVCVCVCGDSRLL